MGKPIVRRPSVAVYYSSCVFQINLNVEAQDNGCRTTDNK